MKHPEEVKKSAVVAYESGETSPAIARRLGVSVPAVLDWLRKAGVKARTTGEARRGRQLKNASPEFLDAIATEYLSGMAPREIANKFGMSVNAVAYRLRLRGAKMRSLAHAKRMETCRKIGASPEDIISNVADLYRDGFSSVQIAAKVGVSNGTVFRMLSEAGVQIRGAGDAAKIRRDKRHAPIKASILAEYTAGNSINALTKKYRVSTATIRRWLNAASITIRTGVRTTQQIAAGVKLCASCGREKPLSEFFNCRDSKSGKRPTCRACDRIRAVAAFGLQLSDVDELISHQGGRCGICSCILNIDEKRYHIDHSHSSGMVRGLLCKVCNWALGIAESKPALMSAAMQDYLDFPPAMELGIVAIHREHNFLADVQHLFPAYGFWNLATGVA